LADISPIRALLDQGCELEADVWCRSWPASLPELPRPLKNWGAPQLVREILAARAFRTAAPEIAGWGLRAALPPRRALREAHEEAPI
jgi:hypothetical protein